MKQLLLRALAITACVAFSFAGARAQVITAERAQEIANNFFKNWKQKSAAVRSTAAVSMKKSADSRILTSESSSDAPTFHILTGANGEGFVIVAGEEIENPIIGYSFEGTIDTNDLPVGFVDYMTDIDAQVKALRKYNAENPQKAAAARSAMQKTNYAATTMGNIVVQLETAKWGQREPFNNLCPEVDNSAVATGCVPTAYAIIAHYHKWPVSAKETTVTNAVTGDKITLGHEYDWTNMLSSYSGTYTETQATAVATLMRDLGYAYEVVYSGNKTESGSGGETPTRFMDIFNYSCNTPNNHGNYATVRETLGNDVLWVQYIKASLDQSLPIPYSSTGDGGRHIFILDGYTDADYFHFNWGWNGQGNGWFTLNAMTPDTESDYSNSHRAYFNLTPNKAKYTVNASVLPENAGTVSINGGAATGEYLEGATVTLAATANTGYTFSNWTKGSEIISTSKSCQVKVASSNNDYVANFLTVGNTTVNVSVTYNSSYGTVTGTSGTVANGTTLTPRLNEEVTLTATPLDGYVFNGWTVTKGTESTNYSGTSLTLVATSEMSVQANFALAETDYIIDNTTGTELTTSRVTNWTHKEVDLTLSSDVNAIAYNGNISLFSGTGGVTYTLTAPTGYTITKYTFSQCKSTSDQYNISIIADSEYALTTSGVDITIDNVNTSSTQFIVRGSNGGDNKSAYTTKIIVTLKKEDAGSGSTPPATTTYTITATADPATAGSVTGGGTYNEGATVTLTATPNSGYTFKNWTSGTTIVSTNATYSFTANATAYTNLVANFEEETTTTTDLSGRYFRLKTLRSNEYMNILDYEDNNGAFGGVNVTALDVNNNDQIFYFTKSGESYKLKSLTDHYLYNDFSSPGYWNVNANSTSDSDCMLLTFESTTEELQYLISCEKGYFMSGPSSQGGNGSNYVYCDTPEKANADTWLLEEVKYTITATANPADGGTANVNGENSVEVTYNGSVTLTATANDGYNFTGWYDSETLISSDNPYTFTATANASYEARFEQDNSIDVLLTDEQGNNYRDRIECDKDIDAVKTALLAKYPFIELGNNGTFEDNTFKCTVTLPFKVSNSENTYWHNIYWPTGTNNNPVYMSALNGTDQHVSKVTEDAEYGNSSYNTSDNNSKISWAIYSVNESLEFKFKNELTGQFIKVTSVADGNAQNTEFVADEAEATVFTLIKDTGSYNGDYSITAKVDDTTGYLCSTSALEYDYTTFYQGNSHPGAWVIFAETEYISKIMDLSLAINLKFGAGNGKYIINDDIQAIITALEDADNIKLNDLIAHGITIEDALKNWPKLQLAISPANSGTTSINGEDGITSKYAPVGHEMTVTATALPGYNFANWTNGTEEASSNAAHTFTLQGATNLTANFEVDNTRLTIATNVETIGGGEGGTVTGAGDYAPGSTVTLSATPSSTNYRFMGWYNENGEQVSTAATYEFTATTNVNYTAKFIKQIFVKIIQPETTNETGIVYGYGYAATWIGNNITLTSTTVDYGTEVKIEVAVYGEFNSDVEFAYWSIDDVKISQENPYTFTATEDRYEFLANFNLKAILAVESGDNGSAYIGSEGITSKEVVTGNTYTISAKANSGYAFDYWAKISGTDETKVSSSAAYTFKLTAELNETVTYKAYFKEITKLEDGKAYRIKARMHDGKYRYIYRDGNQIKWKDSQDDTNNSIFIAQYDFTANDGSLNLISAVGDLGWNYGGEMGKTYVAMKTTAGTAEGTFTMYGISGTEYRSYTAFSGTGTNTTGDNINYYTSKDGSIQKVVNETVNGSTDFIFEEVPFEFNVGIANGSNAKLGTINLPFATTVHPSIIAYAVTGSDENYAYVAPLTLENNILPANTPVLVEAEEAGTYGFAPAPASNIVYETGFAGTLGAKEIADEVNAYILSYKGAGTAIKLYKLASDDRTINANKAYYIDDAGNSSAISFKFVGTTDIDSVNSENENEKVIYDLQGRKLSEITEPGIYIVDGKKIMVK